MGTLLRYPYEVRKESDYFDDIPEIKIDKEMLDLAKHIVQQKSGNFDPARFEDRYEKGLRELIERKAAGETIAAAPKEVQAPNVINLMDALKRSLAAERAERQSASAAPAKKAAAAKKPAAKSAGRARKAG
jgi:DNA end-binding protein Ku